MKKFEFSISGNKYEVELKDVEDNVAHVEVNGTLYNVEIHREVKKSKTPRLVRSEAKVKPGEGNIVRKESVGSQVKAPLPGSIFKILVKEGDAIKKGDVLLIMEAMKMENTVMAEKEGTVKSIRVKTGDNVLQNDILIELD
ncbi:biotin/lipoyl-containing protein [Alkalitalea saponilacus]|uniref:Biotin-requiring enzyme n=1 Tax=Alkalitalea saponilacus TaxID=889453 RepID=A0A1T5H269_9BACT|nr:acetyl-CoA carboxylase biotin carboxyl carrier protein subunit [Alkalitalea saponilacus]ASB50926.1 acetyl-CoA carboxylase biotin carboxyl carrier protein subunit [Alkalitalea saponilacus]SKC14630.1 Biotin-requiring enzyme [Alkalitalea saponilacus]